MRTADDQIRQTIQRCDRSASEDMSTYTERVADALRNLADVVEQESNPHQRLPMWSEVFGFVSERGRADCCRQLGTT